MNPEKSLGARCIRYTGIARSGADSSFMNSTRTKPRSKHTGLHRIFSSTRRKNCQKLPIAWMGACTILWSNPLLVGNQHAAWGVALFRNFIEGDGDTFARSTGFFHQYVGDALRNFAFLLGCATGQHRNLDHWHKRFLP